MLESQEVEETSTGTDRRIKDRKGKINDEQAKRTNLQNSAEILFHLPFPRGHYSQDNKKGRKGGKGGKERRKREGGKERQRERERGKASKHAHTLYFIINIAFSLSRIGLLLNFALASPQIMRLFYQSKSINRNLISIDRIKGR